MTETSAEKFRARLAHNGGESVICKNHDIAVKYLTELAKAREKTAGSAGANSNISAGVRVYLSKALDAGFAAAIKSAVAEYPAVAIADAVSDEADICVATAAALLAEDGALVVDAARVAHEETLFGNISVLVADGGTEFYNNMAEFFTDAAAGKSSVRPDKTVIIAGPSKTADIEKQVVLGMHGPRKLICLVIG